MSRAQIGGVIGFVVGGYLGAGGYGFNVQAASYGYVIGPALGTLQGFAGSLAPNTNDETSSHDGKKLQEQERTIR